MKSDDLYCFTHLGTWTRRASTIVQLPKLNLFRTQAPGTGEYDKLYKDGVYSCAGKPDYLVALVQA